MTKPAPMIAARIWAAKPGPAWTDHPEQPDRHRDRNGGCGKADGYDDAKGREPSDAAAEHQHVDERRREKQRHDRDR